MVSDFKQHTSCLNSKLLNTTQETWAKNYGSTEHGAYFQPKGVRQVRENMKSESDFQEQSLALLWYVQNTVLCKRNRIGKVKKNWESIVFREHLAVACERNTGNLDKTAGIN